MRAALSHATIKEGVCVACGERAVTPCVWRVRGVCGMCVWRVWSVCGVCVACV